ncbi:hypothetical protein AN397_10370 [Corynebacterium pseudotuberculosis]|nr:hypothetical protein AN397_10370 [Corynebacterium pseudotuberculosis]
MKPHHRFFTLRCDADWHGKFDRLLPAPRGEEKTLIQEENMGLPLRDRDVIDRGLVAGEIPKKKNGPHGAGQRNR